VIRLTPRPHPAVSDIASFLRFASTAFRHKRKTLRNNLAPVYGIELITGIKETQRRAEQLSVAELAGLYRKVIGAHG
jgi:16S rRNA A1518/A1519 N6-dimethyltransferase RsmA/KsgA/DIM1 with predicted DNA glycosylase/AP lyase activity